MAGQELGSLAARHSHCVGLGVVLVSAASTFFLWGQPGKGNQPETWSVSSWGTRSLGNQEQFREDSLGEAAFSRPRKHSLMGAAFCSKWCLVGM